MLARQCFMLASRRPNFANICCSGHACRGPRIVARLSSLGLAVRQEARWTCWFSFALRSRDRCGLHFSDRHALRSHAQYSATVPFSHESMKPLLARAHLLVPGDLEDVAATLVLLSVPTLDLNPPDCTMCMLWCVGHWHSRPNSKRDSIGDYSRHPPLSSWLLQRAHWQPQLSCILA